MKESFDKKSKPVTNDIQRNNKQTFQFKDQRKNSLNLNEIAQLADKSKQVKRLKSYQNLADKSLQKKENKTGLPNQLKKGIENLSGYSMDDVKVHFNSGKPAQLQAHAYAQGNNIHLGSGQEKHLPHEAWHVIQQKQGRVKPTLSQNGAAINDDPHLEKEADLMGSKALQLKINTESVPLKKTPETNIQQFIVVTSSDIGKYYQIKRHDNGLFDTGKLVSSSGGGWYNFDVAGVSVAVHGQANIIKQVLAPPVNTFTSHGVAFQKPTGYQFTHTSALAATAPLPHGGWSTVTGGKSSSGVSVGDYGSYGAVQHLEKVGDKLTGDHQPSGAAIKEAIRIMLHNALNQALTRSMARHAYKKAITIVMTDAWHKAQSRTYGGRNSKTQIAADAADLVDAAIKDWEKTVPELQKTMTNKEIQEIWDGMHTLRSNFFKTGSGGYM